ncbi:Na+/H+ antiporter NhaC family protein [Helcobacillus massiliensis]|uniref:Na+/H+ antiporter NhaC n=1 Tax=Helcobacillus massiliensis TaxID=521392 RepID=A0A839QST7_9MICO|nr:Na+/H+ antiporter NhaC [Helcobacillus massiliensis]
MLTAYPVLSLLPPLIAIALVILTKKVLPSLGAGIIVSALLVANVNPLKAASLIWDGIVGLVWADGGIAWDTVLIITFLLELGVIASFVLMAGGTSAFSEWAAKRIRSRRGAQALGGILGMVIFIDDYFNALAVGQVARPITDRQRVSRAKLAYLIDSSSAPVVVLAPFSSWGASIIGIMAPLLAASALTLSQVEGFLLAASMNYYAIGALLLLWLTILLEIDFGAMRAEERRAADGDGVMAEDDEAPGQLSDDLPSHDPGAMRALVVPFVVLVAGVIGGMYITGGLAAGGWGPVETLAEADVTLALNIGGLIALGVALYYCLRYTSPNPEFTPGTRRGGAWEGAKSMMPAILILMFAWVLAAMIEDLGTGAFLADVVHQLSVPAVWLVPILFVVAGLMAFATGTSWGSFGILLPLAGEMMNAVQGGDDVLLAAFGAVLAGAVLGDHCSPISDTTILSSTGAACSVPTHVRTQLPYAITGAIAALAGYVVFALTENGIVGLVVTLVGVTLVAFVVRRILPVIRIPIRHRRYEAKA